MSSCVSLNNMKLYCKCLNICIEIFGEISDTPLSEMFSGELLGEEAAEVEVMQTSSRLPNLLGVKTCGLIKVYTCINCCLFVYATKKEGNGPIIVNKKLLKDPVEISELSLSEHYSPAFKIILKQDDTITEDMFKHRLHEVAAKWLREEAQRTEERIKSYSDQEYAALENHRFRAHKDDILINRVIQAAREKQKLSEVSEEKEDHVRPSHRKIVRNKSINEENTISDGADAVIFPLDDFDHPLFAKDYSDATSDATEDEDDVGKMILLRKSNASHLARSLPIPVPQYMNELAYDSKSNRSPPVPTDIAASIRALAKSVHGDSVFGELPRPRFRNHL